MRSFLGQNGSRISSGVAAVCLLLALLSSACGQTARQAIPTSVPAPTVAASTPTPAPTASTEPTRVPTATNAPTATPVPATPTQAPQTVLLRRPCGGEYVVKANYPLQIYYGGWGVQGKELAEQWATALVIDLTIDGQSIAGTPQPPARDLPYNCQPERDPNAYWIYSIASHAGLPAGTHRVRVVFNALRPLSDGSITFGTGQLLVNDFTLTAR